MDKSAFEKRENSFENEYFHRKDRELAEKLKTVFAKKIDKKNIAQATGITSDQVLDRMVELNLCGELMAAFRLYPLIAIAWADGRVDEKERRAVLQAAEEQGLTPGSKAYAYLEERLREGLQEDGKKLWFLYAAELKKTLSPAQLEAFRKDLLELGKRVADASGGLFSFGFNVSDSERKVLEAVEKALS